ncbi:hypothetical protein lerEdw1_015313 [Lerista edwardsae]|nr:hypothetical protein lerEdw1_015313 [Lerista edwardsae]
MWTFLLRDIPNSCQVLLLLVLFFFIHWIIQKAKGKWFPCLRKKQKKHPKSWITPLEETLEISSETERRLSEDQNLVYTLQTLDKNIHYLAWQMQRISGS